VVDLTGVLTTSRRLEALNVRATELKNELAEVEKQIALCLVELGQLAGPHAAPEDGAPLRHYVLWFLNKNAGHPVAPIDVARELKLDKNGAQNIRGILRRLLAEGRVNQTSHGRYQIAR
jgi:hypothetical protein